MAKCREIMEGSKQVTREAAVQMEAAAAKKVTGIKLKEDKGVLAYQAWVKSGRPVTPKGCPKMRYGLDLDITAPPLFLLGGV